MSSRAGVTGVPTFAAGEHQVVRAHPEPALRQLVEAAGAPTRPHSKALSLKPSSGGRSATAGRNRAVDELFEFLTEFPPTRR